MKPLPEVLRLRRAECKLTNPELARKAGLSPQYVSSLDAGKKAPSPETLRKLAQAFTDTAMEQGSLPPARRDELLRRTATELALAAMGFETERRVEPRPLTADQELQAQGTLRSEVWVVTDVFLETIDREYAQQTAANIEHGVRYIYFVPFSSPDDYWMAVLEDVASAVGGTIESLKPCVSIYQLANCAFTARLRIAWRDGRPEARYALAPAPGGQHLFYEAPVDIAVSAVNALRHLRQKADRNPGTTTRVEHFGEIRRVFPLGDESRKETES